MISQSDPAKASGNVWVFGKPGDNAVGSPWMHHLSASPEERTRCMKWREDRAASAAPLIHILERSHADDLQG